MKRVLLTSLAFIAFTGCTKSFDVFVANPCPNKVSIITYSVPPDGVVSAPLSAKADIPARSVKKVDDAFFDASGRSWAIVVKGFPKPIPVDGRDLINGTLVLSSEVC